MQHAHHGVGRVPPGREDDDAAATTAPIEPEQVRQDVQVRAAQVQAVRRGARAAASATNTFTARPDGRDHEHAAGARPAAARGGASTPPQDEQHDHDQSTTPFTSAARISAR